MRIGMCQITSTPDPQENLRLVRDGARRAAEEGARVALFPEATMACFGVPLGPVAEPLDGPWAAAVRDIADEYGVLVAAGMFTPAPDGRVFNTLLVTGGGRHLGYDKIHLFDAFDFTESRTVAPGGKPVTIDLDGLVLGVATCYDVRFPELFSVLAEQGATVILVAASWGAGPGKREQWELLVRARALDSTSWVLACGQADPAASGARVRGKAPTGIGYSTVADPYGQMSAQLGAGPDVLVADVSADVAAEARRAIPVLTNHRL